MGAFRLIRLGEQLREEISTMILRGMIKDPRVSSFLTINRVEISNDLKFAKVYVSSFLSDSGVRKGVDGLNSAKGFIQSTIAKKLTIRQFPHLTFIADSSMKEGFAMVEKLNRIEKEDLEKAEELKASGYVSENQDFLDSQENEEK